MTRPAPSRPGTRPAAIPRDTTLAELADLVEPEPLRPRRAALPDATVVESVDADPGTQLAIRDAARTRALPYLATAATAATGYTAWGAVEVTTAAAGPAAGATVVAGTWVATAVTLPVLRMVFRHGIPEAWRRRWWMAGTCAACWVDIAAATTPATWTMTAALAAGAAVLSARWAAAHEVPHPYTRPTPAPVSAPDPVPVVETPTFPAIEHSRAADLERAWADRVAVVAVGGTKTILARSRLTGRTELPNATRWMVETEPGSYTFDEMFAKRAKIAAALGVGAAKVILEPYEAGEDVEDDDESRAWLTIVTRDVLRDGVPYRGPRYLDGKVPVGLFADGTGEAHYIAVDGVGARSGLVTGDSGSGKSALLEAIAMALRHSGCWRVLFGDGDPAGGSSPTLNTIADWAESGHDGVLRQLQAVEALLRVRAKLKPTLTEDGNGGLRQIRPEEAGQVRPVREMRPCPQFPGYIWVVDELHRVIDPEMAARMEQIARIGRKYGVVMLAGTQSLLAGDFGGSTPLRANLATANAFILRSTNRSEQHSLGNVTVAPGTLPKGGGYAYSIHGGRTALLRVAWSKTMADYAAGFPACPGDPDSELAINKFRPEATDPSTDLQQRLTALAAWRAAAKNGIDLDDRDDENEPAQPTTVGGHSVPAPLGANVVPIRTTPTPAQPEAAVPQKASQVLNALRSRPGAWRSAELIDKTGLPAWDVSRALGQLVSADLAHRPTGVQGVHAAGPPPPPQEQQN